ncbi:MAG: RdgB/HAM1 family non-canonical purine NTP pyrophosphatase [Myxococcota bacterium]|jgi:XTP/dITP diphosphohydrolase|nr:RdgB/HAM1 family non-canonical purine NTP pyrophosphatase [Myxococcota bacterium]
MTSRLPSRVVLASGNRKKLKELREVLASLPFELLAPEDLDGTTFDVDETETTFEGNARLKAVAYARRFGVAALADDSGLEVDALGGAPGVYSARYAGEGAGDRANLEKLLRTLEGEPRRAARFRCVLVLVDAEGTTIAIASGACEGEILHAERGAGGFGYDPIFLPRGQTLTMAELPSEEKNRLSHRGVAARELAERLRSAR